MERIGIWTQRQIDFFNSEANVVEKGLTGELVKLLYSKKYGHLSSLECEEILFAIAYLEDEDIVWTEDDEIGIYLPKVDFLFESFTISFSEYRYKFDQSEYEPDDIRDEAKKEILRYFCKDHPKWFADKAKEVLEGY